MDQISMADLQAVADRIHHERRCTAEALSHQAMGASRNRRADTDFLAGKLSSLEWACELLDRLWFIRSKGGQNPSSAGMGRPPAPQGSGAPPKPLPPEVEVLREGATRTPCKKGADERWSFVGCSRRDPEQCSQSELLELGVLAHQFDDRKLERAVKRRLLDRFGLQVKFVRKRA